MFKLKYIICLLALLVLLACRKDAVKAPQFEVTTEKTAYKVGDSVVFRFKGTPDIITFYSGEAGKEYQYKDRTEVEGGVTELEFTSRVLYGSQENNLRVLASTNFTGAYDVAGIAAATWVPINDRFTLPTAPAGGLSANTPSGKANMSDLVVKGKPIYFAYQYVGEPSPGPATTQRTWRIVSWSLTNKFADGTVSTLATLANAGWLSVDVENAANKWTVAADMIQLAPMGTLLRTEDWIITKPIYVTRVSPDKGTAIKDYSQRKENFTYIFQKPGTYKVTFVAANATAFDQKELVKEVQITVMP